MILKLLFLVLSIIPLSAIPLSKTTHETGLEIAAVHFQRGEAYKDSLWYSTRAPEYRAHYSYSFPGPMNLYHTIKLQLSYMESQNFFFNSFALGEGNSLLTNILFKCDYLLYLPVTDSSLFSLSLLTGANIGISYRYWGQSSRENLLYDIRTLSLPSGSTLGFSLHKKNRWEWKNTLTMSSGIPLYGTMKHIESPVYNIKQISAIMNFQSSATLHMKKWSFSLNFNLGGSLSAALDNNTEYVGYKSFEETLISSVSLYAGFRL